MSHAAEWSGHARLWVGPGYDSNARREFVSPGVGTQNDAFFFALAQLDGAVLFGDRFRVVGTYDGAGRKFILAPSEDTVVQAAQLEGTAAGPNIQAIGNGPILEGLPVPPSGADQMQADWDEDPRLFLSNWIRDSAANYNDGESTGMPPHPESALSESALQALITFLLTQTGQ